VSGLPPDLVEFCQHDEPTIAFTFGTGMMHASELFRTGLAACERLGVRGIFLTKFRSQLPSEMPRWALHCKFAPFQDLFPRCAAVVHHGGIGTVAKALEAGTPQLILPFGFDQLDNALRVERLGAGRWLKSKHRGVARLAEELGHLTTAPGIAVKAKALAGQFESGQNGLERAAALIDRMILENFQQALT
jgi:UDP:flavonoid glycosyltransferase YjiC (YdhE family)